MIDQLSELCLQLAFDSYEETAPELRADHDEDRHLIYEGAGIVLDLTLRQNSNGTSVQIGGQILPVNDSLDEASNAPVVLESGARKISTRTNSMGEFAFADAPAGALELAITLRNRRFLVQGVGRRHLRDLRIQPVFSKGKYA